MTAQKIPMIAASLTVYLLPVDFSFSIWKSSFVSQGVSTAKPIIQKIGQLQAVSLLLSDKRYSNAVQISSPLHTDSLLSNRSLFLNSVGELPYVSLKAEVNLFGFSYPILLAISVTDNSVSTSSFWAT